MGTPRLRTNAGRVLRESWRRLSDEDLLAQVHGARASVEAFSRATSKAGSLIQSWIRGRTVVEYDHYPPDDVIDEVSGSQFYYHAHRSGVEHGHVHLFWHATRNGRRRRLPSGKVRWVNTAPSHLFAISLDDRGLPVGLFTVNQWVTDGHWFDAVTTLALVDRFRMSAVRRHANSCEWLNEFVRMYRPVISELLVRRDERLARRPDKKEALKDHRLEVLSHVAIDWGADLDALEAELVRRQEPCPQGNGRPHPSHVANPV
ncbi:uncharacterized protein DUF6969 [Ralstonia pickettii]|jgi:hypothetical protein|uniref:DUF6969 domain-containing protein n=1 Tax=Ralstonia thomasii TaxID=3058596 RepID=A0ABM9JIS1_9RALS|nr:hypothetical protein [Ralstonia pickettii]MDH6641333.1 hypothetical protein [Ralstonia sp. GP73]CAJ0794255.1 hypothetical protein LMG18095_02577 [Ralstonia sp. LMG 18095]MBA9852326.1 hypothetical protein [Ralstonia pickettii]MBA9878702.1 hypothetical protein [Ralstonia pickettii]